MNEILNRIHLGVTGNALCHATYGWFCEPEEVIPSEYYEIISYDMAIMPAYEIDLEL